MKLFLDTSVLLAAAGSVSGGSRALFDLAPDQPWILISSHYCLAETARNLGKLEPEAEAVWRRQLRPALTVVADTLVGDHPLLFTKTKDKPVLLTALAEQCDTLITLDRRDFVTLLNRQVYGLWVRTPADFLRQEWDQDRVRL